MKNAFGKQVKFIHKLKRYKKGAERLWLRSSDKEPKEGIIIGVRTLWNGKIHYESVDNGYCSIFIFGDPIKVYLVAIDLKTNPIYVLQTDIINL